MWIPVNPFCPKFGVWLVPSGQLLIKLAVKTLFNKENRNLGLNF